MRRRILALCTGLVSLLAVAAATASAALPDPELTPVDTARQVHHRMLVIPMRYAIPGQDPAPDAVRASEPSLANLRERWTEVEEWYDEVSYGSYHLTTDFTEYLELPLPNDPCEYTWETRQRLIAEADTWLASRGEPTSDSYDLIGIVNATVDGCPLRMNERQTAWGFSAGRLISYLGRTYGDGRVDMPDRNTIAHEIGHSLGAGHSDALFGRTQFGTEDTVPAQVPTVADGAHDAGITAAAASQGDRDVIMGNGGYPSGFSAVHRARMGFLPMSHVTKATAGGGTYRIAPVGRQLSEGPQLLQIDRPGISGYVSDLYVDYRQPNATFPAGHVTDPFPADAGIVNGVIVRVASDLRDSRRFMDTWLLSSSPNGDRRHGSARSNPFGDAQTRRDHQLDWGESLYDPYGDLTITAISGDASGATVRVTPGPPPTATQVTGTGQRITVQAASGSIKNVAASRLANGWIVITDNGNRVEADGCFQRDPHIVICNDAPAMSIDLGDGNDTATIDANFGTRTSVTLNGGPGRDALVGGPEHDVIDGGPGAPDGSDGDLMVGGGAPAGDPDWVSYLSRTEGVRVMRSGASYTDGAPGEHDHVSSDISGLFGGRGDDWLELPVGKPGLLWGGAGHDVLFGSTGRDWIYAHDQTWDYVSCGGGDDLLNLDLGADGGMKDATFGCD